MNNHLLRVATALAMLTAKDVLPQAIAASLVDSATTSSVVASATGRWLHDTPSATTGSVRGLTDGDQKALIMVGPYFQLGSHEYWVSSERHR